MWTASDSWRHCPPRVARGREWLQRFVKVRRGRSRPHGKNWTAPTIPRGFDTSAGVEAMERCGNRRPQVERLVYAWDQGTRGDAEPDGEADDPLIGVSAEPKKRPRTRLTDTEVDAMRTARAQGVSVNALARQFGVHRGTVWAKTHDV